MTYNVQKFQEKIYQALDGDASLGAIISGIYDYVPSSAVFPYIYIAEVMADDYAVMNKSSQEITIFLEIYSDLAGKKQIMEIAEKIHDILQDYEIDDDIITRLRVGKLRVNSLVSRNIQVGELEIRGIIGG